MNIVFVERGYPRPSGVIGGAGTYVQLLAKQLVLQGHTVHVLCGNLAGNNTSTFIDDGVTVHPMIKDSRWAYYLEKVPIARVVGKTLNYMIKGIKIHKALRALDKQQKIDLIEYTEGGDFWNAIFKTFPYITHLHGSAYTFKLNSGEKISLADTLQRKAEHFFIRNAKMVVSPCQKMIDLVEGEMNKKIINAQVIPYPYDPRQTDTPRELQKKVETNKVHLFFASRNTPVKGGELLLDALRLLPSELKDQIQVDFYGYQPRQKTEDLSFLNCHEFVAKEVLLESYKKADVCIIPSYFDNSPNTVYEAMAAAKVVVASAVGGIPEIMGEPPTGFLFEKGSVEDLTNRLTKACKLVLNQQHFGLCKAAQERIHTLGDLKENTIRRLRIYENT